MTNMNCEWIRDIYPDVLNGKVDSAIAQGVREHIASCDECRADAALIDVIHSYRAPLPADLHERVLRAVAQPRSRFRLPAARIAMAATVAAAFIGGSLLLERIPTSSEPVGAATPSVTDHQGLGSVGVEDAMLSGKTSLDDLTVEQLEKLVGETRS